MNHKYTVFYQSPHSLHGKFSKSHEARGLQSLWDYDGGASLSGRVSGLRTAQQLHRVAVRPPSQSGVPAAVLWGNHQAEPATGDSDGTDVQRRPCHKFSITYKSVECETTQRIHGGEPRAGRRAEHAIAQSGKEMTAWYPGNAPAPNTCPVIDELPKVRNGNRA